MSRTSPLTILGLAMIGMLLIPAVALLTGTALWLLWPVTAVEVFHAPAMTWWQSCCGMWTIGIIGASLKSNVEVKGS